MINGASSTMSRFLNVSNGNRAVIPRLPEKNLKVSGDLDVSGKPDKGNDHHPNKGIATREKVCSSILRKITFN